MWPLKVPVKSLPSIEIVPVRAVAVWLLMSSVAETFLVMNRKSVALIFPVQWPTRFVERLTGAGVVGVDVAVGVGVGVGVGVWLVVPAPAPVPAGAVAVGAETGGRSSG